MALAPFMLGRHVGLRARRAWQRGGRWGKVSAALHLLVLEVGWLLAPLFIGLTAVLRIAWLVPIPALRRALERIQISLAATLGDSFAIVDGEVNRVAVLTRFRESLDWLLERCDRVVVVAHSQGAVIAAMALDAWQPPAGQAGRVQRLITYGPGIRKFYETAAVRRGGGLGAAWAGMITLPLLAALVWALVTVLSEGEPLQIRTLLVNLFVMALLALGHWAGLLGAISGHDHPDMSDLRDRLVARDIGWTNLHASHDPVSNGPIFTAAADARAHAFEEIEVANLRSLLLDHSRYWENVDEFVPLVAARAFAGLPGPMGQIGARPERMRSAHLARRDMADALAVVRIYVVGAAALTLAFSGGVVEAWGRLSIGALAGLHQRVQGALGDDLVPALPKLLLSYPYETGVLLVCVTAWAVYRICLRFWWARVRANLMAWLSGGKAGGVPGEVIALAATVFLFSLIAHEARIGESLTYALHFVTLIAPAVVLAWRSSRRARAVNIA
jgi:hypothetical protein